MAARAGMLSTMSVLIALLVCAGQGCVGETAPAQAGASGRIELDDDGSATPHDITLRDILELREPQAPDLSPDGRWLAFQLRQAFLDCNCYRTALFVIPAAGGSSATESRKLLEEPSISNLRWEPDSRHLSYLSARGGSQQIWRVSIAGGEPRPVFAQTPGAGQSFHEGLNSPRDTVRVGVESFEWSPDGKAIAYLTRPAVDPAVLRKMADSGIRYDDERMWGFDIVRGQWERAPTELWVYDTRAGRAHRVWRAPIGSALSWSGASDIRDVTWSPDGRRIALSYSTGARNTVDGYVRYDLGLVDVATGNVMALVATDSMMEGSPTWSSDGRRIAFSSGLGAFSTFDPSASTLALGIVDVATRRARYIARGKIGLTFKLWWLSDSSLAALSAFNASPRRSRWGLQRVHLSNGALDRLTSEHDHVADCGHVVDGHVACVRQSSNIPPAVAIVDLSASRVRDAVAVNRGWDSTVIRSPVTEMRWTNCFGTETNGYLVRPKHPVPGTRPPLLIMLYGFQGTFVAGAERYITSWPVQAFAREGFSVLLWNYPRQQNWRGNDFRAGALDEANNALASLEAAVRLLGHEGLADTTRVGILGWSHGGFGAELAIANSSLFRAASILNGGDYTPVTNWFLGPFTRTLNTKSLAGPPSGSTLANWVAVSPYFGADRVRTPVLMEYDAYEALIGLEMFEAMHQRGVPVEFYIYPDEGHSLVQPVHRMVSMQRNLDWFSFWLLRREARDGARSEEYARWREMRHRLEQLPAPKRRALPGCSDRPLLLQGGDQRR